MGTSPGTGSYILPFPSSSEEQRRIATTTIATRQSTARTLPIIIAAVSLLDVPPELDFNGARLVDVVAETVGVEVVTGTVDVVVVVDDAQEELSNMTFAVV